MKKTYARLVDVPKVEKSAYNHSRFISGLVMHQLIHLSAVEQCFPEEHRTGTNISDLHTEREAADYIGQVTATIHELQGKRRKKGKKRSLRSRTPRKRKSSVRGAKQRPKGKRK
jgi:hypothetical protein